IHLRVSADAFVADEQARLALLLRHRDAHHFAIEAAFVPGGRGALVAAHRPAVGLLPGDAVLAYDRLGGFGGARALAIAGQGLRVGAAPVQTVVEFHVAQASTPAHVGAVVLDVAHALHAGDEHGVGHARLHLHGGVDHGLKPGAAAPVHRVAGDVVRKA